MIDCEYIIDRVVVASMHYYEHIYSEMKLSWCKQDNGNMIRQVAWNNCITVYIFQRTMPESPVRSDG